MKSRRPNNSRATHSGGSSGSRKRRRRKKKCKCTAIHGAACCIAVIISIGLAFILWPIFAAPGEARVAARKAEAVEEAAKHRNLENELVGEAHSRHLRSGKTAPPLPLTPTIVATPSAAADAGAALAASLLAEQVGFFLSSLDSSQRLILINLHYTRTGPRRGQGSRRSKRPHGAHDEGAASVPSLVRRRGSVRCDSCERVRKDLGGAASWVYWRMRHCRRGVLPEI